MVTGEKRYVSYVYRTEGNSLYTQADHAGGARIRGKVSALQSTSRPRHPTNVGQR